MPLQHQLEANRHLWQEALATMDPKLKPFVHSIAKHVMLQLTDSSTNSRLLQRESLQELQGAKKSLKDSLHALSLKSLNLRDQLAEKRRAGLRLTAQRCWILIRLKLAERVVTKLQTKRLRAIEASYHMPSQWLDQAPSSLPTAPLRTVHARASILGESQGSASQINGKVDAQHTVIQQAAVTELHGQLQAAQAETDALRTVIADLQADIACLQQQPSDGESRPSSGRRYESASDRAARVLRLITQFERLMTQERMFEAATLAITGVEGTLRTRKTWLRFDHASLDRHEGWYVYSNALLRHQPTALEQTWCVNAALRRQHPTALAWWASEGLMQGSPMVLWQLWLGLLQSSPSAAGRRLRSR